MRLPAVASFFRGVHLLRHISAPCVGSDDAGVDAPRLGSPADTTSLHETAQHLNGRFLHITDLHPDPFYKPRSSTEQACHRGTGPAGVYGAEISSCDSPYSLLNATLEWIADNIRDEIDFVVWTGDSARHDSDGEIPRNADQVLGTNRWIASKFQEVFRKQGDGASIPIVPTLGNNDILPHNILEAGPNKWLKAYGNIWREFIPEEQRHGFERGGGFYVEVIPNRLAVFSLNTLYFFDHNSAVDGCASRSEPGYEHMEWLRIQLQFIRERGMKAILTGHIPPARTESKQLWDETCWQKYTLFLHQYRDVVVGSLYGHMNIDHFILQDTKHIDLLVAGQPSANQAARALVDEELTTESASSYLDELRVEWSGLPNPALALEDESASKKKKGGKRKKDKALKKIGGPWGERYQVTLVSPSVVPDYFPTLRVVKYNITGIHQKASTTDTRLEIQPTDRFDEEDDLYDPGYDYDNDHMGSGSGDVTESTKKKKKKKNGKKRKKHHKKPSGPDFTIPPPPSKNSPPGPAFSPQTLSLLGYTQFFANLTVLNKPAKSALLKDDADPNLSQNSNRYSGPPTEDVIKPRDFKYEVEYDTFADPVYKLKDMTVLSYIDLAHRIGQYKPIRGAEIDETYYEDREEIDNSFEGNDDTLEDGEDFNAAKKKGKRRKNRKQREINKVWLQFVKRAYVGALDEGEMHILGPAWDSPKLPTGDRHEQIPLNEEL